jgi:prefoldin subunit 5
MLALGACGGDGESDYKDEFEPISKDIVALGEDVGKAVQEASGTTDERLADQFGNFAQELGDLQQKLDELEPPEDLADEQDALTSAMGEVQGALEGIASAAEQGDVDAARQSTEDLIQGSVDLRDARRKLARAVDDL